MKVALDVDDVIAAWYKAACEFCEVEFKKRDHWGKESQEFVLPAWNAIQGDEDFWTNLEPLNTVDFEFDYYITSMPIHLIDNRIEWLKTHGFPQRPVHVGNDKVEIADRLGVDVLIDDKPENIRKWIESGRHAIHYIPPYSSVEPASSYFTYNFGNIKTMLNYIRASKYFNLI